MSSQSYNYFQLNSNDNRNYLLNTIQDMYKQNEHTDVTIYCGDCKIDVHKIILCAISPYLRKILNDVPHCQRSVIILNDCEHTTLLDIFDFIYKGEVCVEYTKLDALLKCAQSLQIDSLVDIITKHPIESYQIVATTVRNNEESSQNSDNNNGDGRKSTERDKKQEQAQQEESNVDNVSVKNEPDSQLDFDDNPPKESMKNDNDERSAVELTNIKREDFMETEETTASQADRSPRIHRFTEDRLRCNVCGKLFVHPYSLHHHRAVHAGGTQCPICNVVLSRKYNLKMHMKARHAQ